MKLTPLDMDHVALPIFEVEASYRFYGELLALPLLSALSGDDWGGRPWLMMIFGLEDGRQLALTALRGAARPPAGELPSETRHIALRVRSLDELTAWKQRLAAHAIDVSEEDHGNQLSLYFSDPNGAIVELTAHRQSSGTASDTDDAHAIVAAWLSAPG